MDSLSLKSFNYDEYNKNTKKAKKNNNLTNKKDVHKNNKTAKNTAKCAMLVSAALALSGCGKAAVPKDVYKNIPETQVNLTEISNIPDDFYIDKIEISDEVKNATNKADEYADVPVVGKHMHANKGAKLVQKAIAQEGNEINGLIDKNVAQGVVSDCWLITAVENLSYTPKGTKYIRNAIKQNEDGSLNVHFIGPDLSYNVTLDEVNKANKEYSLFSRGDDDMLVLELATQKFRQDLKDGNIKIDDTLPKYLYYTNKGDSNAINIGETRQAYWLLTGITDSITASDKDEIDNVINLYKNNKKNSLLDVELKNTAKVKDINGNTNIIYASHGYGVKDINDETITLVSATYSSKDITIPINELYNLPIDMLVYCSFD